MYVVEEERGARREEKEGFSVGMWRKRETEDCGGRKGVLDEVCVYMGGLKAGVY